MVKYIYFLLFISISSCQPNSSTNDMKESPTSDTIQSGKKESSTRESISSKKLRHVVLFKFKDSATDDAIKKAEEAFNALPSKIPEIKDFEWGTNNSPEGLDKGFTHCFFLTFDDEEGRAVYLPHPDHKAFGEILGPVLEDVLVLDYWVGE